jgi:phage gpG-like protein
MSLTPEALADLLRNLNPAMEADPMDEEQVEMTGVVRDCVIENFTDQQNYEGEPWPERKQDYDHDMLRETFTMYGAATVRGQTGSIEIRDRQEIIMGVSVDEVEYAAKQNYGHEESNLPAREYMFVREEHQPRLDEPLEVAMNRVLDAEVDRRQS